MGTATKGEEKHIEKMLMEELPNAPKVAWVYFTLLSSQPCSKYILKKYLKKKKKEEGYLMIEHWPGDIWVQFPNIS